MLILLPKLIKIIAIDNYSIKDWVTQMKDERRKEKIKMHGRFSSFIELPQVVTNCSTSFIIQDDTIYHPRWQYSSFKMTLFHKFTSCQYSSKFYATESLFQDRIL